MDIEQYLKAISKVTFSTTFRASRRTSRRGSPSKTVRNIIDGSFRAMVRDARDIDGLITSDPFAAVQWPDKEIRRRDAFTKEDRDKILDYFRSNESFYYPFIFTMFWTGMRPSECTALRVGDIDLKNGTISNHEVASLRERACAENARESTDDQTFAERRQGFAGSEGAPRH